jgi:anti-sigma factor RsiW
MMRCSESDRIQDYLDGELSPDAATRMRAHVAGCARCATELALYARVFESLSLTPVFDAGPALTERVLAHVLPSQRRRRRRIAQLGWGYAGLVAVTLSGLGLAWMQPAGRQLLFGLSNTASRTLVELSLFVLNTMSSSVLRIADAWKLVDLAAVRLAPLAHALSALVSQPALLLTVLASVTACAGVLWWMRPRTGASAEEARNVGVLGF